MCHWPAQARCCVTKVDAHKQGLLLYESEATLAVVQSRVKDYVFNDVNGCASFVEIQRRYAIGYPCWLIDREDMW
jgi:hypothetical protein